jgi:CheY-like chemotaxis protein
VRRKSAFRCDGAVDRRNPQAPSGSANRIFPRRSVAVSALQREYRTIWWHGNLQNRNRISEEALARRRQPIHNLISTLIRVRRKLAVAKILIVDDDSGVRATIKLLLERVGHSVAVASDGRKGLAVFGSDDFDLLFLDIFMPGMDGLETMRMVHQQHPLIPIIVISGHPIPSGLGSGPDFLTMATRLGAVSSLQKPFKPATLLATVATCLEAAKRPPAFIAAGDGASSSP